MPIRPKNTGVTGMTKSPRSEFDFEEWASLAKTDPEAFEAKRGEVIARFIENASPRMRSRLRGLQWRIDMERRRASNPLSSCMCIFNQMWASVYGERGLLDALHGRDCGPQSESRLAGLVKIDQRRAHHKENLSYPYLNT